VVSAKAFLLRAGRARQFNADRVLQPDVMLSFQWFASEEIIEDESRFIRPRCLFHVTCLNALGQYPAKRYSRDDRMIRDMVSFPATAIP
jgi:hypothetical protein